MQIEFKNQIKLNEEEEEKEEKKSLNVKSIHDDDSVERGEKFFTTNTTLDLES